MAAGTDGELDTSTMAVAALVPGRTRPIDRLREQCVARSPRRDTVLCLSILLLATVLGWSYPAWGGFATERLSLAGDSESFAFYMSWNLHALTHLQNPFVTPYLYAPFGEDLSNGITLPAVGLLMAPVTALWGGTAAYNVALLLAIFMGGAAVFFLTRELTRSAVAATVAGLLMLFCPYFVSHGLGHLNLMFAFGLPYLAYLFLRLLRRTISRPWAIAGVAATFALTAGASTELVVTESFFSVLAVAVALVFARRELRKQLLRACGPVITGVVIGAIAASPVFLAALRHGTPKIPASWPGHFSTDASNLLSANGLTFFGQIRSITTTWTSNVSENSAYIPTVLLLFLVAYAAMRRTRLVLGAATFAVLCFVLSLGPRLVFQGHRSIKMPWSLMAGVPGLDSVLPNRFTAFMFVSLLVVLADALSRRGAIRWIALAVSAIALVMQVPNLHSDNFPADAKLATFVTSGDIRREVAPGEDVLVVPGGQNGPGMLWIAETGFYFRTPTGNGGGGAVPEGLEGALPQALFHRQIDFDYRTQLPPYLAKLGIHTVLVPQDFPNWKAAMDLALPTRPQLVDDVWVYRLP